MLKSLLVVIPALLLCSSLTLAHQRTDIATTSEAVMPLLNGMQVANATLKTAEGAPVSLAALLMQKPSVVLFYRGGWCPYCNRQLAEFKDIEQQLVKLGYQILAISPQSPDELQAQKLKASFAARQLSDDKFAAMGAFGIAYYLDAATEQKYREHNIPLQYDASERAVLPAPAIFITDTRGRVLFSYVNPDYKVRPPASLILAAAQILAP